MLHNIPQELTRLRQWMPTRDGSKAPYNPITGSGDWQDPNNWMEFLDAVDISIRYGGHVGLVLQPENHITSVDTDDKPDKPATDEERDQHALIYRTFKDTYHERSTNWSEDYPGMHYYFFGSIPSCINRHRVELKNDGFIILTGDTDEPKPVINGYDRVIVELYIALGGGSTKQRVESEPETRSDDEIWYTLENSKNNEKLFKAKMGGDSHTDYDIACWITKLTRNRDQAARLLRRTPYAQGKKSDGTVLASSDYHIYSAVDKALAETQVPVIDISKLIKPQPPLQQLPVVTAPKIIQNPMQIAKMPEGWCKEFAKFTLANSMSPLEEAAVFASFLPVCGVGGRVFSASNTGLNQQFTLLALTGTGKDEAVNAAQRVVTRVTLQEPGVAMQAFIADDFASAQGIHRALVSQPVMFGYNKETGMWMERMSKPNPDEHMLMINSVMLDIYNLHGKHLKGRRYAKKENDLGTVYSPTLSTLSVSTPRQFYEFMSLKMLDTGVTGRELIFECEDTEAKSRPYGYVNPEVPWDISEALIRLAVLARRNIADITFGPFAVAATTEGAAALDYWRDEYLRKQNEDNGDVHRAIWSRADLKMRKLAGTLAVSEAMMHPVGDTMQLPIIKPEHVQYASDIVNYCSAQLQNKLKQRGIGNLYMQQEDVFEEAVKWYFSEEANLFTHIKNLEIRQRMYKGREDGVIFKSSIMTRCAGNSAFSGGNRSTAVELERTLKNKIESGRYVRIATEEIFKRYGTRAEAFGVVD